MERLAADLPPGFHYAWAGLSLEEIRAGSQAMYIFALSVVDRVSGARGPV